MAAHSRTTHSQRDPLRPLSIVQYGQTLALPASVAHIGRRLKTVRHVAAGDPAIGSQVAEQVESLLRPQPRRPNAGLAVILKYLALAAGWAARIVRDLGVSALPTPARVESCAGMPCNQNLLNFIPRNTHGIIRIGIGVDVVWLLAQIILAWPDNTFTIATATYEEAKRLRAKLYNRNIKSSLATARHFPEDPKRVVIGTFAALSDPAIQWRDVLLVANAAHALGEHGQRCLLHPDARYRLFGFLPHSTRLSPWEMDWMIATFGVNEIHIPVHGFKKPEVHALWQRFRWHNAPLEETSADQHLALGRHPVRNRYLARVAKALVDNADLALSRDFSPLASVLSERQPVQVIVLAGGVDQALLLAQRLPGWPILTGPFVQTDGLSASARSLLAARQTQDPTGDRVIMTVEGAKQTCLPDHGLVVVVWASGGKCLPPLPEAWQVAPEKATRELLVVDFEDRGNGELARQARRRKRAYAEAEWLPPGTNLVIARIKRFLETRPGRPHE